MWEAHLRLKAKLNCQLQQPELGSSPRSFANDSPSWIIFNMSTLHLQGKSKIPRHDTNNARERDKTNHPTVGTKALHGFAF